MFWILLFCCLNIVWLLDTLHWIMYNMICVTGMYSREILIHVVFFPLVWCLELSKSYIGIYSDTINVIHVKLCMMVLIEMYLLIPRFRVTVMSNSINRKLGVLIQFSGCRTVLIENFVFLSNLVEPFVGLFSKSSR